jgi:hypothetical protein
MGSPRLVHREHCDWQWWLTLSVALGAMKTIALE